MRVILNRFCTKSEGRKNGCAFCTGAGLFTGNYVTFSTSTSTFLLDNNEFVVL